MNFSCFKNYFIELYQTIIVKNRTQNQPSLDLSLARYAAPNPEELELKTFYSVPNISGNINLENAIRWGVGDELENASGNIMIDHIAEKIEADMSGFNDHYLLAFDAKKKFKIFIK